MTNLKVIIRVRPLSQRETDNGCIPAIEIQNHNTVAITNIKVPEANAGDSRQRVRRFTFDCCFPEDATQDDIFTKVEAVVSRAMKRRYHSCVLAYGQSSTGKTHTMMGFPHDPGLTPRLSQKIYDWIQETAIGNEMENMKTTISYLEIYNEKVRDLLRSGDEKCTYLRTLRIREHPKKGPYVQGLTEHQVHDQRELLHWIQKGNENRRVASTLSNTHSSRSHAVVTITCDGVRLYLVDLAGSERAGSKLYATSRFREGANINKSLVALGNVISALAEQPQKLKSNRRRFVPYRDSVLTWLLKDTLGGNSNTVMIATISPSSGCYSETVNTLRFGQRAKLIVSSPVVNEDPKEKTIRELRLEIAKLRELLKESQVQPTGYMPEQYQRHHEATNDADPPLNDYPDSSVCEDPPSSSLSSEKSIENKDIVVLGHVDKEEETQKHSIHQISIEKLIPVMNVKTSISSEKKQIPKFRRTPSIDSIGVMDRSRTSSFGSHESLPTTKPPSVGNKLLPKSSLTQSNLTASRTLSSSNPLIRRRSVDKSLKTLIQRRSIPESPKKTLEKSVETEASKNPVRSKIDSHRKVTPKPKLNIVANVTKRLYLQAKNKDAGTDMEGFDEPKKDVPKELTICSNARLRLKEITQKALRAHRFKQVETQTDTVVLRVKEIATDVQDLRIRIPEVRDVEMMTEPDIKDASVGCSLLDNFKTADTHDLMKLTKSIGVQCSDTPSTQDEDIEIAPKREHSPPRVSFTKYLQNKITPLSGSIECVNPSISNPIYANSVNINVTHHYVNGKRIGSLSDDSLDDQNVCNMLFPTPDLISNHNSLDPNIHAMQNETPDPSNQFKVRYALEHIDSVPYTCTESFENSKPSADLAHVFTIATIKEEITSLNIPTFTYLPEISCYEESFTCHNLPLIQPEFARATAVYSTDSICYDTVTIYEQTVLKSCVKVASNIASTTKDPPSSSMNSFLLQEVPDSLEYHRANETKHVHFSTQSNKNENKLFEAMSSFLKEATNLMTNMSNCTKNFDTSGQPSTVQDFDLQITLDDVSDLKNLFLSDRHTDMIDNRCGFQKETQTDFVPCYESSSQTSLLDTGSQPGRYDNFEVPVNKFDTVLEQACKKLEYKLNAVGRRPSGRLESENDSPLPSLRSYDPSFSGISDGNEDLSLESNTLSYSDYGSLSRRQRRKRMPSCSPSAYLKQLSHMRRHIIESSREDLLNSNT